MDDGLDGMLCEQPAQCCVTGTTVALTMAGSFDLVMPLFRLPKKQIQSVKSVKISDKNIGERGNGIKGHKIIWQIPGLSKPERPKKARRALARLGTSLVRDDPPRDGGLVRVRIRVRVMPPCH